METKRNPDYYYVTINGKPFGACGFDNEAAAMRLAKQAKRELRKSKVMVHAWTQVRVEKL